MAEQEEDVTKWAQAEAEDPCETMGLKEFREMRAVINHVNGGISVEWARKLVGEIDALRARVKVQDDRAMRVNHHLVHAMKETTR